MPTIRNRTKQHLPTVLLTPLSIIQAFALELLVTIGLIAWLSRNSATYWDRSVSDDGLENR